MSLSILQRTAAHIAEFAGINDWYEYFFSPQVTDPDDFLNGIAVRYFRWTDADINGNTPFIMLRQSGDGPSDVLLQQIEVTITLVHNLDAVVRADEAMLQIVRLFRSDAVQPGVVRFDPIGGVRGPMYLENGRPAWQLVVRVFAEDQ